MKRLTKHQRERFDGILDDIISISSGNNWGTPFLDLQGYAGTGKTFIIALLIKELLKRNISVKLTTPTHKSLNVAVKMLQKEGINVANSTIHSHLCLKQIPAMKASTDYILKINPKARLAQKVNLLIVDESSMVSDELYAYIEEHIKNGRADACLFVGDPCQLSPVDGEKNPIYNNADIKHFKLTEVVRQARDNPIINIATTIREAIENNETIDIKGLFNDEQKNVQIFKDMKSWMKDYLYNLNEIHEKQMISFANITVDAYNEFIRSFHYKSQNLPYIIDGEEIVLQSPVVQYNEIIYKNGETVKVERPFKTQEDGMVIWNYNRIKTVDISSQEKYNETKVKLKNDALKDKKLWFLYYQFLEKYNEVKRIYACTIHKSQGSGWNDIYLNLDETLNYTSFVGRDMIYRLVYVALTRTIENIKVLV